MSSEEKSRLIQFLQDSIACERERNKAVETKLDELLEGQAASKTQIKELNETIKTLNDTVKKLKKELGKKEKSLLEKEKLISDLRDQLSRRNSDLFGSNKHPE